VRLARLVSVEIESALQLLGPVCLSVAGFVSCDARYSPNHIFHVSRISTSVSTVGFSPDKNVCYLFTPFPFWYL